MGVGVGVGTGAGVAAGFVVEVVAFVVFDFCVVVAKGFVVVWVAVVDVVGIASVDALPGGVGGVFNATAVGATCTAGASGVPNKIYRENARTTDDVAISCFILFVEPVEKTATIVIASHTLNRMMSSCCRCRGWRGCVVCIRL